MRLNIDLSTMEPEMLIETTACRAIVFFEDIQYLHSQNTLPDVTGLDVNGLIVTASIRTPREIFRCSASS